MKKVTGWVTTLALLGSGAAMATPISGSGLQNSITAMGGTINVHTDQAAPDEQWRLGATGVAASRIQFELSAYAGSNSFGIYDLYSPSTRLTIFGGPDGAGTLGFLFNTVGNSYCAATLANIASPTCVNFNTKAFGFFLSTPANTFYSQTALNADGVDHLVAFQGGPGAGNLNGNPWLANEYLLAWEDLYGGGDRDYEDFVVLVESVVGVPEPTGIALFGLGLFAVGVISRRRANSTKR
jgi:hypothetical protein